MVGQASNSHRHCPSTTEELVLACLPTPPHPHPHYPVPYLPVRLVLAGRRQGGESRKRREKVGLEGEKVPKTHNVSGVERVVSDQRGPMQSSPALLLLAEDNNTSNWEIWDTI